LVIVFSVIKQWLVNIHDQTLLFMPPLLRVLPLAVLHLPLLVIIVKHVLLGRHEWLLHAEMLANKLGKWTDHVLNLILRLVLPL